MLRTIGAVHREAFHEDRSFHVVTAGREFLRVFLDEIPVAAEVPQMKVRVDDRQVRFENRLRLGECEPLLVRCMDAREYRLQIVAPSGARPGFL